MAVMNACRFYEGGISETSIALGESCMDRSLNHGRRLPRFCSRGVYSQFEPVELAHATAWRGSAMLKYRGSTKYCAPCPLKAKCCPNTPARKISRDIHASARDHARMLAGTEAYVRSGRERKKVEVLFGDAKRNLALTRLRLRGLTGASDEFLLMATVQNLRRLAKHAGRSPL